MQLSILILNFLRPILSLKESTPVDLSACEQTSNYYFFSLFSRVFFFSLCFVQRQWRSIGWSTLPSFSPTIDAAAVGKELSLGGDSIVKDSTDGSTTALRWILRCRPDLPINLLQKLFRLRQVRVTSAKEIVFCRFNRTVKVTR